MTRHELDAAGITDPAIRAAYARCRAINATHGRTYFLATRLLPAERRPAVHALYGFARYVDDLVDNAVDLAREDGGTGSVGDVAERIDEAERRLLAGLRDGSDDHPVIAAVVDTVRRHGIAPELFTAFLAAMRMDLSTRDYPTRKDLATYVYGSAQVIGLQMLPVLGTVTDPDEAAPRAAALGEAFQLTNFIRDVAEDLDRDRVYLPADELAAFGVDRDRLAWCRVHGSADRAVRRAVAEQVATTRAVYRVARPGVRMLRPGARTCIATAFTLYSEILDRVAAMDYDVFAGRARVGTARRAQVALPALVTTAVTAAWQRGSAGLRRVPAAPVARDTAP